MKTHEIINEVNMKPGILLQFAKTHPDIMAGFEAELMIPGEYDDGDDEPDFDRDKTLPSNVSMEDIVNFFDASHNDRSMRSLEHDYDEWLSDKTTAYVDKNLKKRISDLIDDDEDMDEDDAEEIANDELIDEFRDSDEASLRRFFRSIDVYTYKDLYDNNSFDWPYKLNNFISEVTPFGEKLKTVLNIETNIHLSGEPVESKNLIDWYIEPDVSINYSDELMGAEIVSPPMPIFTTLEKLRSLLDYTKSIGGKTDSSTGFHVGVSIDNLTHANLDYVKLALFLGDKYVLSKFNRLVSTHAKKYAESSLDNLNLAIFSKAIFQLADNIAEIKLGLIDVASKNIKPINDSKYFSINVHETYVEFRSMGDDYLNRYDEIATTMLRYIRAYHLACHPEEEKQEYYKKMYKLIDNAAPNLSSDTIALFAKYSASNEKIDKSDLSQDIKQLFKTTNKTELLGNVKDVTVNRKYNQQMQKYDDLIKSQAVDKLKTKLDNPDME